MKIWLFLITLFALALLSCESTTDPEKIPDSSDKILYHINVGDSKALYSMNPDGNNKKQLFLNENMIAAWPRYSPDKSKIAFRFSRGTNIHLGIINADGSNFTPIEFYPECYTQSWSPNGKRIVFYSKNLISDENYIMITDLSDDGYSIDASIKGELPVWLPNSNKILYIYQYNLYSVDADTKEKKKIADSVTYYDCSPDGERIVYNKINDYNLYIMNSDGSNSSKFTNGEQYLAIKPFWSPDGKKIVYELVNTKSTNILVVKYFDASARTELTNGQTYSSHYIWSPMSDKIAFNSTDNASPTAIYTINIDGSDLKKLTDGNSSAGVADWK